MVEVLGVENAKSEDKVDDEGPGVRGCVGRGCRGVWESVDRAVSRCKGRAREEAG